MTDQHAELLRRIAETLNVDAREVKLTTVATDIPSWDSMAIVEIVFMLDRDYGVTLPLQVTKSLTSVAGVVKILEDAGKL